MRRKLLTSIADRVVITIQRLTRTIEQLKEGLRSGGAPDHPISEQAPAKHRNQYAHHENTSPQHISVTELNEVPAAIKEYRAESQSENRREKWRFRLEIVGVAAIIGTLYVSCRTLDTLNDTVKATIASNAETRRSNEIDQRAWLSFSMGTVTETIQTGEWATVMPIINSGKTPAHHVRHRSLAIAYDRLPTQAELEPLWKTSQWRTMGVVFPSEQGREMRIQIAIPSPAREQYRARVNSVRMWAYTQVRYCDVFNRVHWINHCANHGFNQPGWDYCGTSTNVVDGPPDQPECRD